MDRVFDSSTGEDSIDDGPERQSVDDAKDLGKTIAGKYVLRRLLGKGGMGAVFEAEHVELGKRVAIKILRAIHAGRGSTETAARFRREARAASAVDSEHIVDVFDVGEDAELGLFMVMELLDGEDLGKLLRRVGRLEPTLALAIARQAALALDKAHAAGVVHRDLKPENVFLRARDLTVTVKLVDFGVAKLLRDVRERASGGVTRAGSVLGTPSYMSPEQAMGLPEVDHRTDLYSLGALLYEMLVGAPAFPQKATYEQTIVAIVTEQPPRVGDNASVAAELDALVTRLMSRDPDARPTSAREVAELIDEVEPRAAARRLSRPALERGAFSDEPPAPPSSRGSVPAITSIRAPLGDTERAVLTPPPPKPEPPRTAALFVAVLVGLAILVGLGVRGRTTPPVQPSPPSSAVVTATPSAAPPSSAPAPIPAAASASSPVVTPAPASAAPAGTPSAAVPAPRPKPASPAPRASGQVGGAGITNEF